MKRYNRATDGPLKKGTMILDRIHWVGVIMEAERTKKYNEHNIINCVDMFGFYHEAGSKYANDVVAILTEDEFNDYKSLLGFGDEKTIYEGKLVGAEEYV